MSCQLVTNRQLRILHIRIRSGTEDGLEIGDRISVGTIRTIELRGQKEVGRKGVVVSPLQRGRPPAVMAEIETGLPLAMREDKIPGILEGPVGLRTATEQIRLQLK